MRPMRSLSSDSIIGVADTACKYWVPEFGAFLIYLATMGILLWRPMGLFGARA